jgi:HK97 gp10 family phage protein
MQIHGADELLAAFAKMPAMVSRTMRDSVKMAARVVQEEARSVHGFTTRTGHLERSVSTAFEEPMTGIVGLSEAAAPYAPFVHQGTAPHIIRPRNKKLLRWPSRGRFTSAKEVFHPGTSPDPFLYQALERKRASVERILNYGVDEAIQKVHLA